MKSLPLVMVRDTMEDLPVFPCPGGYALRAFVDGDERSWARIETSVGEFAGEDEAVRHFDAEFGPFREQLGDRCYVVEDASGQAVGTATAWYGRFEDEERGQVHWVAIAPAYQGRQLAKPLLSAVMARLARGHARAYLTTQTTSYRAINLYLAFGFVPHPMGDNCREG